MVKSYIYPLETTKMQYGGILPYLPMILKMTARGEQH